VNKEFDGELRAAGGKTFSRAPSPPRLLFETVSQLRAAPAQQYLIQGFVPERATGLLFGKWGSFKTMVGFDWCLHLSYGMENWHGAKLPGKTTDILVIAREGSAGFVKRIDAFKQHHKISDDPPGLMFMRSSISFLDDRGFDALTEAIKRTERAFGLVMVDTVGRVLPGADMAKEQPITLFMERLQQIGELTDGTALGVHHENKSGDASGSMFFQNNSDFMHRTTRNEKELKTTIKCEKMKEDADGWSKSVTLVKEILPDGKSSLAIDSVGDTGGASQERAGRGERMLKEALADVVLKHGEMRKPHHDGPERKVVKAEAVREEFIRRYPADSKANAAEAKATAWRRALSKSHESRIIGAREIDGEDYLWLA
jgi:hypothetical protein